MRSFKSLSTITGLLVFAIAATVYVLSAESTGSLWDCGEFILGAYKLEVVHPPGAPLFMLVGRMFITVAELISDTKAHPEYIAYAVNVMSGICTALAAMLLCWVTIMLGKLALVGREESPTTAQAIAIAGAGLIAGLAMTFSTSVWFSAVEGEVYAMSTFFTCLTLWGMVKWYTLPDTPTHDRWLVFVIFSAALSIGVHLLSLLTFPALGILYYLKKYREPRFIGMLVASFVGLLFIPAIQGLVITGIPKMWRQLELLMVNGLGLPFHSGLVPMLLVLFGIFFFGIRYTTYRKPADRIGFLVSLGIYALAAFGAWGLALAAVAWMLDKWVLQKTSPHLQQIMVVSAMMTVIGFSTIGIIVIRANVDPPINMNVPSDPIRLLSYVNREQYGERPLLFGPNFDAQPIDNIVEERYGQVVKEENGKRVERYEIVDERVTYKYDNKDKQFFPRMGDDTQGRPEKYRLWINKPTGKPNFFDNLKFLFRYQLGWMYWRYFAWNFIGRQNDQQGFYAWDKTSGHWESGIEFIDEMRLYPMDKLPEARAKDPSRNHYYFLPFILGLLGLFFHFSKRPNEAFALLVLFLVTGIGIIIYSNQPPNEPRERDYVLVGSFFTFCIWIGMGALWLFDWLASKINPSGAAALALAAGLVPPIIMGTQNWDDHSRHGHYAARDYAVNFLESCAPNAIIFTYGDNDTYPLWYAQEVEGIRTDVRVVNLSLIQVDWYINLLRRRINDSPPLKLTIPAEAYRGRKRNAVFYYNPSENDKEMNAIDWLRFIGEDHPLQTQRGRPVESYMPSKKVYIEVDSVKAVELGHYDPAEGLPFVSRIPVQLPNRSYLTKDEIAILDVIASNINSRPVYFAVTCRPEKMFGLQDYMELEGLALRIVPVKSQSERGLYTYGFGRVDTETVYNNIMNKFRWGNFDKIDTHVAYSYGPSIQSLRVVIMRTARRLKDKGENEKAIALVEKFFEAFPNFNFPYDWNTLQVLSVMVEAGGYEKAKPHIEILARNIAEQLAFHQTLSPDRISEGGDFETEHTLALNAKDLLLKMVEDQNDPEELEKLQKIFALQ
ncbi:MAG: membrane protein [Saprospiraceae bacterium]|nr:MAG: membrane protein [Saprospiraceae bacterium]